MNTRKLILKKVKSKGFVTSSEIVKLTGISRQTIAQYFRELISKKRLIKFGSTHNAKYIQYTKSKSLHLKNSKESVFSAIYLNKDLQEDRVFLEASMKMKLQKKLSDNVYKIAQFAFTEMLNNVIDHSRSRKVKILIRCLNGIFDFQVDDKGIGVYENIRKKFKLKDHFEAVEHLLKGKQTTLPSKHSGQGIFFTSKIADLFVLESAYLNLTINNTENEVYLDDLKMFHRGTRVIFSIKQRSRKNLRDLFAQFESDDYEFDKTKVTVHLSQKHNKHVSRSEAKRLLFGLEKFKRIVLDFKGVTGIGQGFADEIFRVFKSNYPEIKTETINASPSVEYMIKRTRK
ncbi:MAG: DUF4325 domain-containing protein [Candidatus Melainabacteria bacterium]|nr:DUF4325 domain-containing protein [Candidatus Melainabacteria bacterium]